MAFQIFCGLPDKTKADFIVHLGDDYNVLDVLKSYQSESNKLNGLSKIFEKPPKTVPTVFEILATFTDKKIDALTLCASKFILSPDDLQTILIGFDNERTKLKAIKKLKPQLIEAKINIPVLVSLFVSEDRKMKIIKYFSDDISHQDFDEIIQMLNNKNNITKTCIKYVPRKARFYSHHKIIEFLKQIGSDNIELLEKLIIAKYPFDSDFLIEIFNIYKGGSFETAVSALLVKFTTNEKIIEQLTPKKPSKPTQDCDSDDEMDDDSDEESSETSISMLKKYFPNPSVLKGEATIQCGKRKFTYINGVSTDLGVKGLPTEEQSNIDHQKESLKTIDAKICKICFEANYSYMLMPCNHTCLCSLCVRKVCIQSEKQCPVCRTKIARVQKVFKY